MLDATLPPGGLQAVIDSRLEPNRNEAEGSVAFQIVALLCTSSET